MAVVSTLRPTKYPVAMLLARCNVYIKTRLKRSPQSPRVLAIVVLTLFILSAGYGSRRWYNQRVADDVRGQRLWRRNSGLRGSDGSRTIFVPYRTSTAPVVIYPTKIITFDAHRRLFLNPPRAARIGDGRLRPHVHVPPPQTKPGLNLAFLHQFLSLLSIMVPHWNSKESGLLVSQAVFLMLRTYLSLVVARLDGEIVRDLVSGNGRAFLWGIIKWCGIGGMLSQYPCYEPYTYSPTTVFRRQSAGASMRK